MKACLTVNMETSPDIILHMVYTAEIARFSHSSQVIRRFFSKKSDEPFKNKQTTKNKKPRISIMNVFLKMARPDYSTVRLTVTNPPTWSFR